MSQRVQALDRIDAALMRMRRLWAPHTSGRSAANAEPGVDLSTVLVVHVIEELGSPSIAQVAEHLDVAPATASRLCDKAVASGAVIKTASPADARRTDLTLTATGKQLGKRARDFRRDYLAEVLTDWPAADVIEFESLLTRFAAAVRHASPPTPSPRPRAPSTTEGAS